MENTENSFLELLNFGFFKGGMPPEPLLFCLVYDKSLITALYCFGDKENCFCLCHCALKGQEAIHARPFVSRYPNHMNVINCSKAD